MNFSSFYKNKKNKIISIFTKSKKARTNNITMARAKQQMNNSGTQVAKKAKSNEGPAKIPDEFVLLDKYWKASNYLSVGQVRLR